MSAERKPLAMTRYCDCRGLGGGCGEFGGGGLGVLSLDSNTARHGALSCGVFDRKHSAILLASGICAPHSRNTSGVQAICCCMVPRFSSATAEVPPAKAVVKPTREKIRKIRFLRMAAPSSSHMGR
jgi:hypothetical protein